MSAFAQETRLYIPSNSWMWTWQKKKSSLTEQTCCFYELCPSRPFQKFPLSLFSLITSCKLGKGKQRAGVRVGLQATINCFPNEHNWDAIVAVWGHRINFFSCFHYNVYISVSRQGHTHVLESIYSIHLHILTLLFSAAPSSKSLLAFLGFSNDCSLVLTH